MSQEITSKPSGDTDTASPASTPQQSKKRKMEDTGSENTSSVNGQKTIPHNDQNTLQNVLKDFELVKVLREDDRHKFICLHGSLPSKESQTTAEETDGNKEEQSDKDSLRQDAIVLLEKKSFDVQSVEECVQTALAGETLQNDIYSTYDMVSGTSKPDLKATLIFPATQKHISKYSTHEPFIVHETPELYRDVTLPCIEASKFSIQWVYNILEKKQEADRIVVEDSDPETGFVIVPDMKWDRAKLQSLYLQCIVHKHGLRSLRDLRGEHLPLLRNIMDKGLEAIKRLYNIGPDKLRIYFHYQPSYYHLHVHFTHLQFDAPGSDVMRAHLLNDVIDNLAIDPEFYTKKTLSFVVREGDNLYRGFVDSGYLEK